MYRLLFLIIVATTEASADESPPPLPQFPEISWRWVHSILPGGCNGKKDGFYKVGTCISYYNWCYNQIEYLEVCPDQMVFNGTVCDYPFNVAECRTQSSNSSNLCEGSHDGQYKLEVCSPNMFFCFGGTLRLRVCPEPLVYNIRMTYCTELPKVCRTVTSPRLEVLKPLVEQETNTVDTSPSSPFCSNRVDGYFEDGCSNHFYFCKDKQTQKLFCPPGTFFDAVKAACQMREDVPACNPSPTVRSRPAPSWSLPSSPVAPTPSLSVEDFDCSNRDWGFYRVVPACSPVFIQCYSNLKFVHKCEDGLVYNPGNGWCDYEERVEECDGSPSVEDLVPPLSDDSRVRPYDIAYHLVGQGRGRDASCAGKADGYYAYGCSQWYYSCDAGILIQHRCSGALLRFNEETNECNHLKTVKECQLMDSRPSRYLVQIFTCHGRSDGDYRLLACSQYFARCVNGIMEHKKCPGEMRFDGKTRKCKIRSEVEVCKPIDLSPEDTTPKFTCEVDGVYKSSRCSERYIRCEKGKMTYDSCEGNWKFDGQRCENSFKIAACKYHVYNPSHHKEKTT